MADDTLVLPSSSEIEEELEEVEVDDLDFMAGFRWTIQNGTGIGDW